MKVDNSARPGGIIRISLIFYNMKVCCVFSLESPHWGNSNEYTQHTVFNILKKVTLNYPKSAVMGFFPMGLKNEFETVVVNEPSVFEPLKFYCIVLIKPYSVQLIIIVRYIDQAHDCMVMKHMFYILTRKTNNFHYPSFTQD